MQKLRLVIITGLPGTGKTTLARELAKRHALPLISKDAIKEPLMDVLGSDAPGSRALSDMSFAIMFSLSKELLAHGASLILEGNFRAGEHEAPLLAALPAQQANIIQVLCRMDEDQRRSILLGRSRDGARHAGHRDAWQMDRVPACDVFLELPGERRSYRVGSRPCEALF